LLKEEERAKNTTLPESSFEDEEDDITDTYGEDSGDNSDDGADGYRTSDAEEDSPKVDITG
jgi:hypothetical protein